MLFNSSIKITKLIIQIIPSKKQSLLTTYININIPYVFFSDVIIIDKSNQ